MKKLMTVMTCVALLVSGAALGASANPTKKKVCNKDGTKCKMVTVHEGRPSQHKQNSSAKYKDYKALENACRAVWVDDKPDGLNTCQQGEHDSGSIDVLGKCGNSVSNGINTQNSGKCSFNLQLSCQKRDGSWENTQASCKSLLSAPDKLRNDDGKVVSN